MLDYKLYYDLIITAITKIENSVKDKKSLDEEDIWDATLMRLQVIGENARNVPRSIRRKYKNINWADIINLRNLISHKYQRVEKEVIGEFIADTMPLLKKIFEGELNAP